VAAVGGAQAPAPHARLGAACGAGYMTAVLGHTGHMDTERQWSRPDPGTPGERPTTPMPPPGWRPRRRRLPLALVAGIVVLLAVLLAVGRLTDLRLWPSLPNPFASRHVDRSQPVLLKSIENLKVYKAASGNFQVLVDLEQSNKGIPLLLKGERTLFVAAGNVDAEVDFTTIDRGAIEVSADGRSARVTLPHAHLTKARIDPDRSYVFSRKRGLLDRLGSVLSDNPTSERQLYQLAENRLEAAATQSGLVEQAERNTRAMLESMLRSLGYRDVTVTFRDPPT
jgi:hypothetical protein